MQEWLTAHSVADLAAFEPWIGGMRELHYQRDQALVTAGERSGRVFFIRQGMVRLFYSTADGKERNKAFFCAGDVTGAISAAITDSAAPFGVQALEPTIAISADFGTLLQLAENHTDVNRLYVDLLSDAFIRNEQREAMLLTCNAEQRYQWLLDHQPELLQRVPQFQLASYLGVEPVSLSRLKRKLTDEGYSAPGTVESH